MGTNIPWGGSGAGTPSARGSTPVSVTMKTVEYRITMPMSAEEYQRGQIYTLCKVSEAETGGGSGITVQVNEPWTDANGVEGRHTSKTYHLEGKVPAFLRMLMPKGSLKLNEESWIAYPYCKTVITNPKYMKDDFLLKLETMNLPGKGHLENPLNLSDKLLKKRVI